MPMELIAIKTRKIVAGDDVASVLMRASSSPSIGSGSAQHDTHSILLPNDILVISSKAVATAEGRIIDLSKSTVSAVAKKYAAAAQLSEEFCQAVLEETAFRSGKVVGSCPGALLTELQPWLRASSTLANARSAQHDRLGTILTANAGLDQSNIAEGYAVGWPLDPVESVGRLRRELEKQIRTMDKGLRTRDEKALVPSPYPLVHHCAVIISDSCCTPRRLGVTAFALAVSGLDPHSSQKGKLDLFGKPLRITTEAIADQLATAANFLMGNAGQGVPAVVIRDHGLPLSNFERWVEGIS